MYESKEFDLRRERRSREYKVMNQKSPDASGSDESTGVPCQIFLSSPSRVGIVISPEGSRSVFPQQPGLKVAGSPAEVSVASFSPSKSKVVVFLA